MKMKVNTKRGILAAVMLTVATVAASTGCAERTYLTRSHGRAYHEAFGRQALNPEPRKPGKGDPTEGLDSQEAAAVARTYRRGLAGKEGGGDPNAQHQMVLVGPPAAGQPNSAYMPPPSVPGGQ